MIPQIVWAVLSVGGIAYVVYNHGDAKKPASHAMKAFSASVTFLIYYLGGACDTMTPALGAIIAYYVIWFVGPGNTRVNAWSGIHVQPLWVVLLYYTGFFAPWGLVP